MVLRADTLCVHIFSFCHPRMRLWALNSSLPRIPPSMTSTSRSPVSGSLALVSQALSVSQHRVFCVCFLSQNVVPPSSFKGWIIFCHIPSLAYRFISMNIWVFLCPGCKNSSSTDGRWCAGLIFISPFPVCSGAELPGESMEVSLHPEWMWLLFGEE